MSSYHITSKQHLVYITPSLVVVLVLLLSGGRRCRSRSRRCRRRPRRQILRFVGGVDDVHCGGVVHLSGGRRVRWRRGRLQVVMCVVRDGGRTTGFLLDHNLNNMQELDFRKRNLYSHSDIFFEKKRTKDLLTMETRAMKSLIMNCNAIVGTAVLITKKSRIRRLPVRAAVGGVAAVSAAPESPAVGVGAAVAPVRRQIRLVPGPG